MAENMATAAPATASAIPTGPVAAAPTRKLTFASVAAMAPKTPDQAKSNKADIKAAVLTSPNPVPAAVTASKGQPKTPVAEAPSHSFAKLQISESPGAPRETRDRDPPRPSQLERLEDEKTHLSISSTKAPSLGGKSVASGATFAMDEKESIWPDDSASVQAAEDDDSNSGPNSGEPSSRLGSDNGAKAFQYQYREISERAGINGVQRPPPFPSRPVVVAPEDAQKPSTQHSLAAHPLLPVAEDGSAIGRIPPMPAVINAPDEKLLEALQSPRDRLFLLQLEQQFMAFISESSEPVLSLPPCNSFHRLLAHRLGDYYQLSHFVDNSPSVVRLHKNPNTHLPTPLNKLTKSVSGQEEPNASQASRRIIQRRPHGEVAPSQSGENTTVSSAIPSVPTSDAGDGPDAKASGLASPTDSTSAKDKTQRTREQRETDYKKARERIFGFTETDSAEGGPSNEHSHGASRASSVSGNKGRKKKNYRKDDDDFDSRSKYHVYVPGMVRPGGSMFDPSTGATAYYGSLMSPNSTAQMMQPAFYPGYNQQYPSVPHMQPYQMPMQPMAQGQGQIGGYVQQQPQQFISYNSLQQPQIPDQFYGHPVQHQQASMFPQSTATSPALSNVGPLRPPSQDPSWNQNGYASQFQAFNGLAGPYHAPQAAPPMVQPGPQNGASGMPYAYGQLPFSPNAQASHTAHPVPGSFNRQNLNPQTRSFVPGAVNAAPMGPPAVAPSFAGPTSYPQQHQHQPLPQQPYPVPSHYGPPNHAPMPAMQPTAPVLQQHYFPAAGPNGPGVASSPTAAARKPTSVRSGPGSAAGAGVASSPPPPSSSPRSSSSLAKWGTPATLPPKPPPPATASAAPTNGAAGLHAGAHARPTPPEAKAS